MTERGALDRLELQPLRRQAPGPQQIEIRVHATGLNFKDVMNVLGMVPGDPLPLGNECAGVVVAVGDAVRDWKIGDEVIALAPAAFSSFVTLGTEFVVRKPPALSFARAASIPIAFITAEHALRRIGRLQAGERVLIHAAAGGVGLAAVQVALRIGAEVYATAGSDAKHAYLQSLGVTHVYSSRTLDFGAAIVADTGGAGVDVVLNSLAGEFIAPSLGLLAPGGRFVEIGKSGLLSDAQIRALRDGREYHVVDWSETARQDPAQIRSLLGECVDAAESGVYTPLPVRTFPLSRVVEAFRYMAQAKHIGKIVVTQPQPVSIRGDGTYLVTGGLGGLGMVTARWLAERGARHLVLMSRHDAAADAQPALAELEAMGCRVAVWPGDVARREDVAGVFDRIRREMPPLRGIVHAAGVLDDAALVHLDAARMAPVFAPKVDGTRNLHELSLDLPIDLFAMYSSIAAVLGAPGQANHAAANVFMDGMAAQRRDHGLPSLSINWGVWSEVGEATHGSVQARAAAMGVGTIAPEQGMGILEQMLNENVNRIIVMPVQWARFNRTAPFYAQLVAPARPVEAAQRHTAKGPDWSRRLTETPATKRLGVLQALVREQASRVLGVDDGQVTEATPLKEMGLDSLMAVELRNRLGTELALKRKLPATLVFDYPTVQALAGYLLQELYGTAEPAAATAPAKDASAGGLIDSLEGLSDAEVDAMLAAKGMAA